VGFAVVGVEQPIKPRVPAEMQEQPDLDLGATQVVQELLSMRLKPEQPRELSVGTRVSL
jgi:hypothetical protein